MDKIFEQAGSGIKKGVEGLGEFLTAPLAKLKGDKKEDKEEKAAPVIINIINQAKGEDNDKDKGASASATAIAR